MTQIVNGLPATKTRLALTRAVTEPGRVYYEPNAKNAYDRVAGVKVTDRVRDLLRAGWIRVATAEERQRYESQHLVYYRLTEFGRAALKGEAR